MNNETHIHTLAHTPTHTPRIEKKRMDGAVTVTSYESFVLNQTVLGYSKRKRNCGDEQSTTTSASAA